MFGAQGTVILLWVVLAFSAVMGCREKKPAEESPAKETLPLAEPATHGKISKEAARQPRIAVTKGGIMLGKSFLSFPFEAAALISELGKPSRTQKNPLNDLSLTWDDSGVFALDAKGGVQINVYLHPEPRMTPSAPKSMYEGSVEIADHQINADTKPSDLTDIGFQQNPDMHMIWQMSLEGVLLVVRTDMDGKYIIHITMYAQD